MAYRLSLILQKRIDNPLVLGRSKGFVDDRRFNNITLCQAEAMLRDLYMLHRNLLVLFINFLMSKAGYDNMLVCLLGDLSEDDVKMKTLSTDCRYKKSENSVEVYRFQNQGVLDERYWIEVATSKMENSAIRDDYFPFAPEEDDRIPQFENEHLSSLDRYGLYLEWNLFFLNSKCEVLKVKVVELSKEALRVSDVEEGGFHIVTGSVFDEEKYCTYLKRTFDSTSYSYIKPDRYLVIFLDERVLRYVTEHIPQTYGVQLTDLNGFVQAVGASESAIRSWFSVRDAIIQQFGGFLGLSKTLNTSDVKEHIERLKRELKLAQEALDYRCSVEETITHVARFVEGGVGLLYKLKTGTNGNQLRFVDKLDAIKEILDEKSGEDIYYQLRYVWKVRPYGAHYKQKKADRSVAESVLPIAHRFAIDLQRIANSWLPLTR